MTDSIYGALIYDRISRDRYNAGENVEMRLAECREYVEDESWPLLGEFSDNDISASEYARKPRPGYEKLIRAIESYEGELPLCVVTSEMRGLYRRLDELLELIEMAKRTKLARIQCTDGAAYPLETGEGIHTAIAAVNNNVLESRKLSDRMKRKKRWRAVKGAWGGRRPFGYNLITVTIEGPRGPAPASSLEINEGEAGCVREAARRVLAGESLYLVCKDWNLRPVPQSTGGRWDPTQLKSMLTAPVMIGVREHRGNTYPALWEPILDRETHELLIGRLSDPARGANHGNTRKHLLTGFVFCGLCGARLVCAQCEGALRYRCMKDSYRNGCGKIGRAARPLEELAREAVFYVLDHEALHVGLAAEAGDGVEGQLHGELERIRQQRELNKRRFLIDNTISEADYLWSEDELEPRMQQIRQKLASLEQPRRAFDAVPQRGEELRRAWANEGLGFRRTALGLVFDRILVHPTRPGRRPFDLAAIEPIWKPEVADIAEPEPNWPAPIDERFST